MFLVPSVVTMSIVATRMYRSLADFFSPDIGNGLDNPPKVDHIRIVPITKQISTIPVPHHNRMEVALYASHEHSQSSASQTGQHVPYMSSDAQFGDKSKPHGLNLDDDMESGEESA